MGRIHQPPLLANKSTWFERTRYALRNFTLSPLLVIRSLNSEASYINEIRHKGSHVAFYVWIIIFSETTVVIFISALLLSSVQSFVSKLLALRRT